MTQRGEMAGKLQQELKQKKPFGSTEVEAFLSLVKTADTLLRELERLLKPYGLTATQYNALRILRGAGEEGLTCSELSERLINEDPDVTRLLDRLEKRALVERTRDSKDRRVVMTRITAAGLELLENVDVDQLHSQQLKHIPKQRLKELIETLELIRNP
jgi:DNA-binding MarR family transcriptional regulator